MNFDATIRELEEKRDFYAAAITALRKIATCETAKAASEPKPSRRKRRPMSAESKARIAEGQRLRWERHRAATGNGAQPHADQVQ
jgi:hypothetical protein